MYLLWNWTDDRGRWLVVGAFDTRHEANRAAKRRYGMAKRDQVPGYTTIVLPEGTGPDRRPNRV